MRRPRRLILSLWLAAAPPLAAQQPDSAATAPPRRSNARAAVVQTLIANVAINRLNAWVIGNTWANTGPEFWSRNLRLGWEWDENSFKLNMLAHPYAGTLYFNAARANGLDFWEASPVAMLGSWTWEYFAEVNRPSLNDFFMTSFGGIALGEVFHRLAASIRHDRATGPLRQAREIAALPFDPVGGINRLLRGDWSRVSPNPPEYDPGAYVFRLGIGGAIATDSGVADTVTRRATISAELSYGDPFLTRYRAPFDVFFVRAQLDPGSGGVLRASGRLFGRSLSGDSARHQHRVAINQRYDLLMNRAHQFGAQSVELGIQSRWYIGKRFTLRTEAFGDLVLLGALDAPRSGVGERDYDFGSGAGLRFDLVLERNNVPLLATRSRTEYIHTVSGAEADHVVAMGGFEVTLPVWRRLGVGLSTWVYARTSRYSDRPRNESEYPEARLFLTYTTRGIPEPHGLGP